MRLLRMMPNALLAGTLLPALAAWAARHWFAGGTAAELERQIQTFDFVMIGVVVLVWTAVLTIVIACVIVWLMKGPAYVADAYELSDRDKPGP